ncbi:MAG: hypothetical protein R3E58_07980 [Phycisphaerae bacterium]
MTTASSGRPWVYGRGDRCRTGLVMPIIPGETPCLRCVFENAPTAGNESDVRHGRRGSGQPSTSSSMQSVETFKLLMGVLATTQCKNWMSIDVWSGRVVQLSVAKPEGACICCGKRQFEYLEGKVVSLTTTLCGRNAVQIQPQSNRKVSTDLAALARKMAMVSRDEVKQSEYLVRAMVEGYELTVFKDGRTIIKGTKNADEARSIHAKYIGS